MYERASPKLNQCSWGQAACNQKYISTKFGQENTFMVEGKRPSERNKFFRTLAV